MIWLTRCGHVAAGLLPAVCVLLLPWAPPAQAAGTAPGSLSVAYMEGKPPVQLALDRPRLLVRKADLPALRERAKARYANVIQSFSAWLDEREKLGLPAVAQAAGGEGRKRALVGGRGSPASGGLTGNAAVNLAMLYQVTGDEKFATPAKAYMLAWVEEMRQCLADAAKGSHNKDDYLALIGMSFNSFGGSEVEVELVMDLLWEALSPQERAGAVSVILTHALYRYHGRDKGHVQFPIEGYGGITGREYKTGDGRAVSRFRQFVLHGPRDALACLACYGPEADASGLDFAPLLKSAVGWWKEDALDYFRVKAGDNGGALFTPWGGYYYCHALKVLLASVWQNVAGEPLMREPFMRKLMLPPLYFSYPVPRGQFPRSAMTFYFSGRAELFHPLILPARTGSPADQYVFLNRPDEGPSQVAWGRRGKTILSLTGEAARASAGRFKDRTALEPAAFHSPLVWLLLAGLIDPDAPALKLEELPETAHFDGLGMVSMRSSWHEGATFCAFQAGRFYGYCRLSNGAFWIYKQAPVTFQPQYEMWRSSVHNIVTVYDPEAKMGIAGRALFEPKPKPDGGQTLSEKHLTGIGPNGQKDLWYASGGTWEQGRITGFQTTREWDYVAADVTDSYPPESVTECTRQIVFVKPDHFVIFDRVSAAKAEFPKRWNIHFLEMCEPVVQADQFVARWTGHFTPNPARQYAYGYLFSRQGLKPDQPGGVLFGRTLLPKGAALNKIVVDVSKPDTKLFGGPFTVADLKANTFPHRWGVPIDVNSPFFKLEVAPPTPRKRDLFLHVLQAASAGVDKMVPCELVEKDSRVGTSLTIAGQVVEVLFDKEGIRGQDGYCRMGGAISIAGQTKEFPREVVDSYAGWKGDPRFDKWMIDEKFDIVIPAADRKPPR